MHERREATKLFDGVIPKLTQLHYELSGTFHPWCQSLFSSGLVKLDLTLHAGLKFNHCLDLLQRCPNLISLLIRGPCHQIVVPVSPIRQVKLACLKRLVIIKIIPLIIGEILKRVCYPPDAFVHITNEPQWDVLVRYNPDDALRSGPVLVPASFGDFPLTEFE